MIRHNLYDVDREKKTAFCTACGHTEIHIAKSRTKRTPRVVCLKRWEELLQEAKQKRDEKRRLQPNWKPRHSLSAIDIETMIATCAVCGRIDIQKHTRKGYTYYICAAKVRQYIRKYCRLHYTPRRVSTSAHILSEIDEEKRTAVCSKCGAVAIYVWQGKRKIIRRCINASIRSGMPSQPRQVV